MYLVAAYLAVPALWTRYARRHPALEDLPGITYTSSGIHGDAINVALIGTKADIIKAMLQAKWYPADPITFRTSLEIAADSVLGRPFDDAPVSSLFLAGRKQDLAFEKPVGHDPRQRHHVRFWQTDTRDTDGRPVWLGAATFDTKVGFSHTTGQITHHTAAAIDEERDTLFDDLKGANALEDSYIVRGFHKTLQGRNGGGDPWHSDGNLYAGVVKPSGS
jgi:hypothetical protein